MKKIIIILTLLFVSLNLHAPENRVNVFLKIGGNDMLSDKTVNYWKKQFIKELEKQIGLPYVLGGGQMGEWKGHDNLDEDGKPIGFDCCGGIIYAIEETTGIELKGRPVHSFISTVWLKEIKEGELQEGDLILVDIPGMKNGNLLRDENDKIVYGKFNHVMTYAPYGKYDIITTEGIGGDYRLNPKSAANTRRWKFSEFKRISGYNFKGKTKYKFFRINWTWLYNWKQSNQI